MSPNAITGILAIDHVGIAVAELAPALAFYESTFNARLLHQEINEEQGVVEAMLAIGAGTEIGTEIGTEMRAQTLIQLLAPLDADSPIARFLERHGAGVQQVAFRVRDVLDASRQARALGIRTLYDEPKNGTKGARINFLHPKDCGGVLIELIESG